MSATMRIFTFVDAAGAAVVCARDAAAARDALVGARSEAELPAPPANVPVRELATFDTVPVVELLAARSFSVDQVRKDEAAELIARAFHESYERQAPKHGYSTREASAKPWDEVPAQNRTLMIDVARDLIERGVILPGFGVRAGAAGYSREQLVGHAHAHDPEPMG